VIRRSSLAALSVLALVACTRSAAAPPGDGGSAATRAPRASSAAPSTTRPIDPNFDFGQRIVIGRTAVRPLWLVSQVHRPVVFQNRSRSRQVLVFDNYGTLRSPPIPPGGSWSFTPTTPVSIVYHSATNPRISGKIQVTLVEP
jgi:hypothetical protein